MTTGPDGTAISGWLVPGTWYVKEISTPSGYVLDNTTKEVAVPSLGLGVLEITNYLEDNTGTISVTKRLSGTTPTITGKVFTFTLTGGSISKTVTIAAGETGNFGPLPFGTYTLYESSMPNCYKFFDFENYTEDGDKKISVTIGSEVKTVNITAINEKVDCHLWLKKINKDNENQTLPGAKFRLERFDGTELKETRDVTIGSDGMLLNELLPGHWHVTEIEAPNGYVLDPTPQEINLEVYSEETLTFKNSPKNDTTPTPTPTPTPDDHEWPTPTPTNYQTPSPTPVKPDMPRTGDAPSLGLLLLLPAAAVLGLIYMKARRRSGNR
jgi:uncharacterized surface anchored protein